jgi:mannose-6-phosphate isomerase
VLPALLGEAVPAEQPWAEIWMGAHPADPSRLPDGRSLAEVVPDLPYLVKLLAAEEPLSVQAHPDRERARAGYAAEEARGVPLTAPERTYKDANHKPELLVALTTVEALVGFRPVDEVVAVAGALGSDRLDAVLEPLLADGPAEQRLRAAFGRLLLTPAYERPALVTEVVDRLGRRPSVGADADVAHWVTRLAVDRPDDPGVLAPLFLRLLVLPPGAGLFLAPGVLHAYLHGAGVEVQASSDNVLRGGLTAKHVDVAELLDVVAYDQSPPPHVAPRPVAPGVEAYDVPVADFAVWRLRPDGADLAVPGSGPRLALCVEGVATVDGLRLGPGRAAFLDPAPAGHEPAVANVTGSATLFVVAPG